MLINNHKDRALSIEIDYLKSERRILLNQQDFEEYREIVIEMMKLEDKIINEIQQKVCKSVKIEVNAFRERFANLRKENPYEFDLGLLDFNSDRSKANFAQQTDRNLIKHVFEYE